MTQTDLIQTLLSRCESLDPERASVMVKLFFTEILQALVAGKQVTLRRFGSFQLKVRPSQRAYDPRRRQKILVQNRKFILFKASPLLLKELDTLKKVIVEK